MFDVNRNTDLTTVTYNEARTGLIEASIARLNSDKASFSRHEMESLIRSIVIRSFNTGASWAQDNPDEAPSFTKTGQLNK
jgi:hypothetical protein